MKKFTINCNFGGQMEPFAVYIGLPKLGNHPLDNQSKWLSDNRGGTIPSDVMKAITQLQELAKKNKVSLEELCVYALGTEEEQEELTAQHEASKENKINSNTKQEIKEIKQSSQDEDENDEDDKN